MNETLRAALAARLLASADDELILAHRDAEWTGHAPILEEDIALANIAQDELGHATVWYELRQALTGDDPDRLAFFRDAAEFRNVRLVEQPRGDWAFTMLRQYLFDAWELALLTRLRASAYRPLADAAQRMRKEEVYHFRHSNAWVQRLGRGSDESHRRMQRALDELWPLAGQLFCPEEGDEALAAGKVWPDPQQVQQAWLDAVLPALRQAGLTEPAAPAVQDDRRTHSLHLEALLADMQMVARSDPEAVW